MSSKQKFYVYLSGSVKKGSSDTRSDELFWSERDEDAIISSVGEGTVLLNPSKTPIIRNDYWGNYGCDLFLVQRADVVLVDLRDKKGIGIGAELMYAQHLGKTVLGWLPSNSYYKRNFVPQVSGEDLHNWTHPFAFGLCDRLFETLEAACTTMKQIRSGTHVAEDRKTSEQAIAHFKRLYPDFVNSLD